MIEIVRLFLQRCEVVVSREIVIVENTRLVRLLYFYYILLAYSSFAILITLLLALFSKQKQCRPCYYCIS